MVQVSELVPVNDIESKSFLDKIVPLGRLTELIKGLKSQGSRIVHCHGVFDLVHPGHIRHLQAAKREGDFLVVTVTPDEYVNKGPGRPVFNQHLRAESLAALECVDYVTINEWPTAMETIRLLKPDVYVKGSEYARREDDVTGMIYGEEEAVLSVGGRIHFTDDITFSSSNLINNHFSILPPEAADWMRAFRERFSTDEVLGCLEATSKLKVLVVGESIVDEYVFCDGLGKSTKDPILAFQYRSTERYPGGSLAVANHLAGFCDEVGLTTFLGESDRSEELIRQSLLPKIRPHFLTQRAAPTIHKRRFVDGHTGARLLEVYMMHDDPLSAESEEDLAQAFADQVGDYDVVVVADYGHGMLTQPSIRELTTRAKFLAVNTQANAGNRGFNTITKYPRADYVCLAMHEVALETRMKHAGWRELVLEVASRIGCPRFTVTWGKYGSLHYTPESCFTEVPALATHVTDRVGAGDAVLAVTSLLVAQKAPWDIVGFVGNIAGAQMVSDLGNRMSVNRASIARHAISLMK
jgi:rfaE bifunctional protein kinase chain/domain/rfaE bifunctional protein nucleotidyltransferase chain/domain